MQAEGETQVLLLWSTDDDITYIGWEGGGDNDGCKQNQASWCRVCPHSPACGDVTNLLVGSTEDRNGSDVKLNLSDVSFSQREHDCQQQQKEPATPSEPGPWRWYHCHKYIHNFTAAGHRLQQEEAFVSFQKTGAYYRRSPPLMGCR